MFDTRITFRQSTAILLFRHLQLQPDYASSYKGFLPIGGHSPPYDTGNYKVGRAKRNHKFSLFSIHFSLLFSFRFKSSPVPVQC